MAEGSKAREKLNKPNYTHVMFRREKQLDINGVSLDLFPVRQKSEKLRCFLSEFDTTGKSQYHFAVSLSSLKLM